MSEHLIYGVKVYIFVCLEILHHVQKIFISFVLTGFVPSDVTSANNMAAALRRVCVVGGGGVISRYAQLFTVNGASITRISQSVGVKQPH